MTREEEIARGNPLLNLEQALHGESRGPKMPTQQRWDEDLIFRNQAVETPDLSKRGFVNDLTRTCALLTSRHRVPQKVYECACGPTHPSVTSNNPVFYVLIVS